MGVDLLLAMLIAYYMTKNTVQDLAWKATGQDPPSYRREQQRIKDRKNRRPITERREARTFLVNAWEDAWETAGEKRARIHEKRRKQRLEDWEREDIEAAEDEAYERNDREPAPNPPQAEPHRPAKPGGGADTSEPSGVCEICADRVPLTELGAVTFNDRTLSACKLCRDSVAHAKRAREDAQGPGPADQPNSGPAADDANGGAQIIQFTDLQRTAAGTTTAEENDVSGETTNLSAALAYTQGMAATCREGVTSVETSMSGLTAGGVTGPTLDALSQAGEALSQADAAFQSAHAALVNHIQVREAYEANSDAGDKQFVTAD